MVLVIEVILVSSLFPVTVLLRHSGVMHAHCSLQQHISVLLPTVRKAAVCPLTQGSQPIPALTKGQKAEGLMRGVCLTMLHDPVL